MNAKTDHSRKYGIAGTKYGYIRVSTIQQDPEMLGQRDRLMKAGIKPENIREDFGISGMKASRPGLDELLDLVDKGDSITVTELSRLGRSVVNMLPLVESLDKRGVSLVILNMGGNPLDTKSAMGRGFLIILAVLAQIERELTAERIRASKTAKTEKGEWTGGMRHWGYELDGEGSITTRETEARWLRQAAAEVREERSFEPCARLAARMNREGVGRTDDYRHDPANMRWTGAKIRDYLMSPRIAGLVPQDDGFIEGVKAEWPAIIPVEEWLEVRAILEAERKARSHSRPGPGGGYRPRFLGTNLFWCGPCLQENRQVLLKGGEDYYYCTKDHRRPDGQTRAYGRRHRVPREPVDRFVTGIAIAKLREMEEANLIPEPRGDDPRAPLFAEEQRLLNELDWLDEERTAGRRAGGVMSH